MQLNLAFAQVDGDFPEATFEGEEWHRAARAGTLASRASSKISKSICCGENVSWSCETRKLFRLAIEVDGECYLRTRLALLKEKLHQVDQLASDGELPECRNYG